MSNAKHPNQMISKKTISIESAHEMKARLRMEEAKACHQRRLETIQAVAMLGTSLVVGGLCLYVSLSSRFHQDEKSWARSIVQIIAGGIVGFMTGKSLNKNNASH